MDLFGEDSQAPATESAASLTKVDPAKASAELHDQGRKLPRQLHLGTSSWHFPGWDGLVWAGDYAESTLSKYGLAAYAQHPLMRSVSLDRAFYRPLTASQYAAYATRVPADFRFVVKAPSLVADAQIRGEAGRVKQANPAFLDPQLAIDDFVTPALEGLGDKIGALVFQLSPLPSGWLNRLPEFYERLSRLLNALPSLKPIAPDGVIAVEVRNPELLTPGFAQILKAAGATYCLGLHAKMPPIAEQIPLLRALWPAPLVCRWSLHRKHGAFGYDDAKGLYEPFDRMVDPDPETRQTLARVAAGTLSRDMPVYITINNKAEGSAPLSVAALAEAIDLIRRSA